MAARNTARRALPRTYDFVLKIMSACGASQGEVCISQLVVVARRRARATYLVIWHNYDSDSLRPARITAAVRRAP